MKGKTLKHPFLIFALLLSIIGSASSVKKMRIVSPMKTIGKPAI